MIKAVIFDLEDTLVLNTYSHVTEKAIVRLIVDVFEISSEEAIEWLQAYRALYPSTTASIQNMGIPLQLFYSYLNKLEFDHRLCTAVCAKNAIIELKKLMISIGLLTNAPRTLCLKILDAAGIDASYFDSIVAGDDVEEPKPSVEPFVRILSLLEISGKEAIMVGDREDVDLKPAKQMGMTTILIGTKNITKIADRACENLIEVSRFVEEETRKNEFKAIKNGLGDLS